MKRKHTFKPVYTYAGWTVWRMRIGRGTWWNVTREGAPAPKGGYASNGYIEKVKGIEDLIYKSAVVADEYKKAGVT